MSPQAATHPNDRRPIVILLATLGIVVLLAVLYLLLKSSGESADDQSVPRSPMPGQVVDESFDVEGGAVSVDEGGQVLVASTTGRDPFEPLDDSTNADSSKASTSSSDTKSSNPTTKSTASPKPTSEPKPSNATTSPASKSTGASTDNKVASTEPQPIEPEPIDTGKDSQDAVLVKLVDIREDSVIARVDGERTTLYLNEPGKDAVIYVAPLGGGCAWMGRTDTEIRVSVCKGKAERV
ncbi:MAG: hypothetical protein R2720_11215 [Candidatus Nanopelagicales bacterium]